MSETNPSDAGGDEASRLAPAKINLWLAVHGPRDDGYHELSSLLLALDWGDELRARGSTRPGIRLSLTGPALSDDIPRDEHNLVWRAARLALDRSRDLGGCAPPGLELALHKRVPSQAGLGGGSSDAVAALELVQELAGVDLGLEWKRAQCAALGADCSFFLDVGASGLALCEGIGERVTPWSGATPPWFVTLLMPGAVSSTGAVFGALDPRPGPRRACPFDTDLVRAPLELLRAGLHTDLEAAALAVVPELRIWRDWLDGHDAGHYRLSGSGSTFFGLHTSEAQARAELEDLRRGALASGLALRGAQLARPQAGQPSRPHQGDPSP